MLTLLTQWKHSHSVLCKCIPVFGAACCYGNVLIPLLQRKKQLSGFVLPSSELSNPEPTALHPLPSHTPPPPTPSINPHKYQQKYLLCKGGCSSSLARGRHLKQQKSLFSPRSVGMWHKLVDFYQSWLVSSAVREQGPEGGCDWWAVIRFREHVIAGGGGGSVGTGVNKGCSLVLWTLTTHLVPKWSWIWCQFTDTTHILLCLGVWGSLEWETVRSLLLNDWALSSVTKVALACVSHTHTTCAHKLQQHLLCQHNAFSRYDVDPIIS